MPTKPKRVPSRRRYTRRKRTRMAAVRAFWTNLMPGIGFMVVWGVNSVMDSGLPWWVGLPIGGACYAAKRYWWPDEEF